MAMLDLTERLAGILRQWEGVNVQPDRFGGVEFRMGRREMGHVHSNGVADVLLPVRLRRNVVAAGRAEPHHTLPHSGWVSFRLRTEHDVPAVVDLFRLNYERMRGHPPRTLMSPVLAAPILLADRVADDLPA